MRSGGRFGMILHGEHRQRFVAKAGDGVVVEVYVRYLDIGGQRIGVDREAVIMGGDLDLAGSQVFYWLVAAAVAEFHLVGFRTERLA